MRDGEVEEAVWDLGHDVSRVVCQGNDEVVADVVVPGSPREEAAARGVGSCHEAAGGAMFGPLDGVLLEQPAPGCDGAGEFDVHGVDDGEGGVVGIPMVPEPLLQSGVFLLKRSQPLLGDVEHGARHRIRRLGRALAVQQMLESGGALLGFFSCSLRVDHGLLEPVDDPVEVDALSVVWGRVPVQRATDVANREGGPPVMLVRVPPVRLMLRWVPRMLLVLLVLPRGHVGCPRAARVADPPRKLTGARERTAAGGEARRRGCGVCPNRVLPVLLRVCCP